MYSAGKDVGKSTVRATAALVVALDHANGLFVEPHVGETWTTLILALGAHHAVMIFFVISGYMITMSILLNIRRNGSFCFQEFFISRLARIYPPLLYSIAVCILFLLLINAFELPGGANNPYSIGIYPQMRTAYTLSSRDVIDALTMSNGLLQVNGPLWSLSIEFWIYLAVGFSVLCVSAPRTIGKLAAGAFALFCINKLFTVNTHATFYFGVWLCGSLFAVINQYLGWFSVIRWRTVIPLLVLIAAVVALFPSLVLSGGRVFGAEESLVQFLFVLFWSLLVIPTSNLRSNLVGRVFDRLGDCSYTLYIVHFPIMLFLLSLYQHLIVVSLVSSIATACVGFLICIIVSSLSAGLVEDKKMFTRWLEAGLSQLKSIFFRRLWTR